MIPTFALRLICGLSSIWCVAPRKLITSGFFRIQMLLVLGLSVLAAVTANQIHGSLAGDAVLLQSWEFALSLCLAFLSFAGSMAWTLERRRGGVIFALLILAVSLTAILLPVIGLGYVSAIQVGDALSTAWLLGATTAAMLLGHWYLTATGMALQPLITYTRLFGGAVLLRMAMVAWFALASRGAPDSNWTLQALRWGGLIGPLIMAGLTLRILKYRNTQSATGVLYAATILVFMGEMAASLMVSAQAN